MGIRFLCPACTKRINVKEHQAGKRGFCPKCGAPVQIPLASQFADGPGPDEETTNRPAPPSAAAVATPAGQVPVGRIVAMPGPAVDPLTEAPGAAWYVASEGQPQPFGPADPPTMHQWLLEGRVAPMSLVWRQDWPEWRPAAAVWPHLAGATAVAIPPAPQPPPAPVSAPPLGGSPPLMPAAAIGSAAPQPGIYYQRRGGNWYAITVVILVLLVAALGAVMYWVLTRDPGSSAASQARTAERRGMENNRFAFLERTRR
ncbi:MAG: DUF4339 domain-containing protein [Pirellulales bacterium]